jgi:hypothetical protein
VSASSYSASLSSSISRCQALQTLHDFRHQYRGVRLIKLRKWCKVWRAWHLDIDDEVDEKVWWAWHLDIDDENIEASASSNSTTTSSSISRCQALQILHHFRNQYRGVSLFKFYINFVINIEVSDSSNSTSLSSSISRCEPLQILHHFVDEKVWWAWHLDIGDEVYVKFDKPDTSILMTKAM